MDHMRIVLLLLGPMVFGACRAQDAPQRHASSSPTTAPATQPAEAAALLEEPPVLTAWIEGNDTFIEVSLGNIQKQHKRYARLEGFKNRQAEFMKLAQMLAFSSSPQAKPKLKWSKEQVIEMLGPADIAGDNLIYHLKGQNDGEIVVMIFENNSLKTFGWNKKDNGPEAPKR